MYTMPGDRVGRPKNLYPWWTSEFSTNPTNILNPVATWRAISPNQAFYTRIDTAIIPLGAGSIISAIPDSTVLGGNQRSPSSVDLQLLRNNANQVAGYITPGAGGFGEGNALIAGRRNSIRSTGAQGPTYCAIVGGDGNTISLTGGTNAGGSFIGGGVTVTMVVNGTTGARGNIGGTTIDFGGNAGNGANIGGTNITINNNASFNLAGQQNTTSHDFAGTMGSYATTRSTNSFNIGANNSDAVIGVNQLTIYPIGKHTGDATPTELTTDNAAAGTNNRACGVVAAAEAIYFFGYAFASAGSSSNVQTWKIEGFLYHVAGVLTLGINTCTFGFGAGTLNTTPAVLTLGIIGGAANQLAITATGVVGLTVRWSGMIFAVHRRG